MSEVLDAWIEMRDDDCSEIFFALIYVSLFAPFFSIDLEMQKLSYQNKRLED